MKRPQAPSSVGAGHAREQKGAGIGAFLVPEHKVARMAASYKAIGVAHMAALCPRVLLHPYPFNDHYNYHKKAHQPSVPAFSPGPYPPMIEHTGNGFQSFDPGLPHRRYGQAPGN